MKVRKCGLIYVPKNIREKYKDRKFLVYEENGKIVLEPYEIDDPALKYALKLQTFKYNCIYIPRELYRKFANHVFSIIDEGDRIVLDPVKLD